MNGLIAAQSSSVLLYFFSLSIRSIFNLRINTSNNETLHQRGAAEVTSLRATIDRLEEERAAMRAANAREVAAVEAVTAAVEGELARVVGENEALAMELSVLKKIQAEVDPDRGPTEKEEDKGDGDEA